MDCARIVKEVRSGKHGRIIPAVPLPSKIPPTLNNTRGRTTERRGSITRDKGPSPKMENIRRRTREGQENIIREKGPSEPLNVHNIPETPVITPINLPSPPPLIPSSTATLPSRDELFLEHGEYEPDRAFREAMMRDLFGTIKEEPLRSKSGLQGIQEEPGCNAASTKANKSAISKERPSQLSTQAYNANGPSGALEDAKVELGTAYGSLSVHGHFLEEINNTKTREEIVAHNVDVSNYTLSNQWSECSVSPPPSINLEPNLPVEKEDTRSKSESIHSPSICSTPTLDGIKEWSYTGISATCHHGLNPEAKEFFQRETVTRNVGMVEGIVIDTSGPFLCHSGCTMEIAGEAFYQNTALHEDFSAEIRAFEEEIAIDKANGEKEQVFLGLNPKNEGPCPEHAQNQMPAMQMEQSSWGSPTRQISYTKWDCFNDPQQLRSPPYSEEQCYRLSSTPSLPYAAPRPNYVPLSNSWGEDAHSPRTSLYNKKGYNKQRSPWKSHLEHRPYRPRFGSFTENDYYAINHAFPAPLRSPKDLQDSTYSGIQHHHINQCGERHNQLFSFPVNYSNNEFRRQLKNPSFPSFPSFLPAPPYNFPSFPQVGSITDMLSGQMEQNDTYGQPKGHSSINSYAKYLQPSFEHSTVPCPICYGYVSRGETCSCVINSAMCTRQNCLSVPCELDMNTAPPTEQQVYSSLYRLPSYFQYTNPHVLEQPLRPLELPFRSWKGKTLDPMRPYVSSTPQPQFVMPRIEVSECMKGGSKVWDEGLPSAQKLKVEREMVCQGVWDEVSNEELKESAVSHSAASAQSKASGDMQNNATGKLTGGGVRKLIPDFKVKHIEEPKTLVKPWPSARNSDIEERQGRKSKYSTKPVCLNKPVHDQQAVQVPQKSRDAPKHYRLIFKNGIRAYTYGILDEHICNSNSAFFKEECKSVNSNGIVVIDFNDPFITKTGLDICIKYLVTGSNPQKATEHFDVNEIQSAGSVKKALTALSCACRLGFLELQDYLLKQYIVPCMNNDTAELLVQYLLFTVPEERLYYQTLGEVIRNATISWLSANLEPELVIFPTEYTEIGILDNSQSRQLYDKHSVIGRLLLLITFTPLREWLEASCVRYKSAKIQKAFLETVVSRREARRKQFLQAHRSISGRAITIRESLYRRLKEYSTYYERVCVDKQSRGELGLSREYEMDQRFKWLDDDKIRRDRSAIFVNYRSEDGLDDKREPIRKGNRKDHLNHCRGHGAGNRREYNDRRLERACDTSPPKEHILQAFSVAEAHTKTQNNQSCNSEGISSTNVNCNIHLAHQEEQMQITSLESTKVSFPQNSLHFGPENVHGKQKSIPEDPQKSCKKQRAPPLPLSGATPPEQRTAAEIYSSAFSNSTRGYSFQEFSIPEPLTLARTPMRMSDFIARTQEQVAARITREPAATSMPHPTEEIKTLRLLEEQKRNEGVEGDRVEEKAIGMRNKRKNRKKNKKAAAAKWKKGEDEGEDNMITALMDTDEISQELEIAAKPETTANCKEAERDEESGLETFGVDANEVDFMRATKSTAVTSLVSKGKKEKSKMKKKNKEVNPFNGTSASSTPAQISADDPVTPSHY